MTNAKLTMGSLVLTLLIGMSGAADARDQFQRGYQDGYGRSR
jgi:hypothetical protein